MVRVLRRLAGLKTKFINVQGENQTSITGIQATSPNIFNEAILLCLQSTLRTLDLSHLAAARYARRMNQDLGAFVTGDTEFLSKKRELSENIGIPFLSPREYTEGTGL